MPGFDSSPPATSTTGAPDRDLCTPLPRKEGEMLRIQWREYLGHNYVDLRVWFKGQDGELRPTKTGMTIKLGELFTASDALAAACELAKTVRR